MDYADMMSALRTGPGGLTTPIAYVSSDLYAPFVMD